MVEWIEALGAGLLRALVAVRAGLIIATAAFLQLAITAANEAQQLDDPLKKLFQGIAIAFGLFSVTTAVLFVLDQVRAYIRRPPSN